MINVFDIETFGRNPINPYCVCLVYRNKKYYFWGIRCIELFLTFIFKMCCSNTIIYAHNLTFDGGLLINKIPSYYTFSCNHTCVRSCSIYSLGIVFNNKLIVFRCSAKILPMRVSEIAEKLSLPRKLDLDYTKINLESLNDPTIKNEVVRYCFRDVEITKRFLELVNNEFQNIIPDWLYYSYSISGISLRLFRMKFNINSIDLCIDSELDSMLRPSYYGGRCEVFGNTEKGDYIFHYDFTGMYTSRLSEEYPIGVGEYVDKPGIIKKSGFYFVIVYSSGFDIPVLPYRCPKTKRLIFPNGRFSGVYWGEELLLFIENGGVILDILWGYEYSTIGFPFKNFSEYCSTSRKRSNVAKIIWKLIPNSFIGRLGIRNDSKKTYIFKETDYDHMSPDIICDKKINNFYIVEKRSDDFLKNYGNVVYASITTSKARILWWKTAYEVIKNGGRLLYCDTDSLFIAYKRNVNGEKHGCIVWDSKIPGTIIEEALFATNKAYAIKNNEWKVKVKGVPRNTINIDEFKDIYRNKKNLGIKVDYFNKKNLLIDIKEINKIINISNYDKRIIVNNTRTIPLEINEDTLINEKL